MDFSCVLSFITQEGSPGCSLRTNFLTFPGNYMHETNTLPVRFSNICSILLHESPSENGIRNFPKSNLTLLNDPKVFQYHRQFFLINYSIFSNLWHAIPSNRNRCTSSRLLTVISISVPFHILYRKALIMHLSTYP